MLANSDQTQLPTGISAGAQAEDVSGDIACSICYRACAAESPGTPFRERERERLHIVLLSCGEPGSAPAPPTICADVDYNESKRVREIIYKRFLVRVTIVIDQLGPRPWRLACLSRPFNAFYVGQRHT